MKIVTKSQTNTFQNGEHCRAIEYPLGDKDINGAVIEVNGKYPEKGRVVNTVCKELAYIIHGSGKVVIEEKTLTFNEGDTILIEPNEKYYWEGNFSMFVPCVPAWYPEQHKDVE